MSVTDDELFSAISNYHERNPDTKGGVITKFFLVMEGIDVDGDRCIDYTWTEDMKTWDVRGLLHETLDQQLSGQLADQLMGDDDG